MEDLATTLVKDSMSVAIANRATADQVVDLAPLGFSHGLSIGFGFDMGFPVGLN